MKRNFARGFNGCFVGVYVGLVVFGLFVIASAVIEWVSSAYRERPDILVGIALMLGFFALCGAVGAVLGVTRRI